MTFVFDDNDLLIAFDKAGKFVSSALLRRPLSITSAAPIVWTEDTANKVYEAWDNPPHPEIPEATAVDLGNHWSLETR